MVQFIYFFTENTPPVYGVPFTKFTHNAEELARGSSAFQMNVLFVFFFIFRMKCESRFRHNFILLAAIDSVTSMVSLSSGYYQIVSLSLLLCIVRNQTSLKIKFVSEVNFISLFLFQSLSTFHQFFYCNPFLFTFEKSGILSTYDIRGMVVFDLTAVLYSLFMVEFCILFVL